MRISTSMMFDRGVSAIQRQTGNLLHTQQQVSTGRRIVTPADDPIASARVLELTQSRGINDQFRLNIGYADDNLKLMENKLTGAGDILQYVRERAVQAGNGVQTAEDMRYIAADMRSQFDALIAISNSRDGQGEYVFSGYRSEIQPFEGNLSGMAYMGDQGTRSIQVASSRFMPVSLPGIDIFDRTRKIDVTDTRPATAENPTTNDALYSFSGDQNQGTGGGLEVSFTNIGLPPTDPNSPRNPENQGRRYVITYSEAPIGDPTSGSYAISEVVPGVGRNPLVANLPPGVPYAFNGIEIDLPAYVPPAIPGDPGSLISDDSFEVYVASTSTFENFSLFVSALEDHSGLGMAGGVAFALENFDPAIENVLKTRAQVGSQMIELEQLKNVGSDLDLQYAEAISRMQDVDYAEAISNLTLTQTYLQAAQQSFARISNLSLFNYIN